jgi:nucleoside-diphosphate-sugar epimerase
MKRILVLGSRGVVGSVVVPHLRKLGHTVMGADLMAAIPDESYSPVDVRHATDLQQLFMSFDPTVVVNLAGSVGRVHASRLRQASADINVMGALNVAEICRRWGSYLIHFSTSEVYGDALENESVTPEPRNWYGQTKLLGEQAVRYSDPFALILRPFMMYHESEPFGAHRSAMIRFAEQIARGKKVVVHEGAKRSWLYLRDVADLIHYLAEKETNGVMNIGNPEPAMSMEVLAGKLGACMGANAEFVYGPVVDVTIRLEKKPSLLRMPPEIVAKLTTHEVGIRRVALRARDRVSREEAVCA